MKNHTFLKCYLFLAMMALIGHAFGQETTNEARIGEMEYATLAAACTAANGMTGNVTIETLVPDITMTSAVTFNKTGLNVTLKTADELLNASPSITTVITRGYDGNNGALFAASITFTVDNIIFDGKEGDTQHTGRAINATGGTLTISNSTFRNFRNAGEGGAIKTTVEATIANSIFRYCSVPNSSNCNAGGAINTNKAIIIRNDTDEEVGFYNCTSSTSGGGIQAVSAAVTIENTAAGSIVFNNCGGNNDGGAVDINTGKPFTINNTGSGTVSFIDCYSDAGGVVCAESANIIITNRNSSDPEQSGTIDIIRCYTNGAYAGGGLYAVNITIINDGELNFDGCYTAQNKKVGGGIYCSGNLSITGTENVTTGKLSFKDCHAGENGGGGIYAGGAVTIAQPGGATFTNCEAVAGDGGGIFAGRGITIRKTGSGDITFTNCVARARGGGIYAAGAASTVSGAVFTDCRSAGYGAGMFLTGSNGMVQMVSNCRFEGHVSLAENIVNAANGGGGLVIGTSGNVSDCIFNDCTTSQIGGAIYMWGGQSDSGSIANCVINGHNTLAENIPNAAQGGAIYIDADNGSAFNNVSITDCWTTGNGGGLYASDVFTSTEGAVSFNNCYTTGGLGGGAYFANTTGLGKAGTTGNTVTFTNCHADGSGKSGGGAYFVGAVTIQEGTTVSFGGDQPLDACSAAANGGGGYFASTVTMNASSLSFEDCYSTSGNGGGAYFYSTVTLNEGATLSFGGSDTDDACTATGSGGGAYYNNTVTLNENAEAAFKTCSAGVNGGGAYFNGTVTVKEGATLSFGGTDTDDACTATGSGGGAYFYSTVTLNENAEATFKNCSAGVNGGGAYFNGAVTVKDGATLSLGGTDTNDACTATGSGGGAYFNNTVTLNEGAEAAFTNCLASTNGGGAYFNVATGFAGNVSFTGNTATNNGGGVYFNTAGTLNSNATVTDNMATNGGGVYFNNTGTVEGATITGNGANNMGGGIYANNNLSLGNTTQIVGNYIESDDPSNGGGVYMNNNRTITVGNTSNGATENHVRIFDNFAHSFTINTIVYADTIVYDTTDSRLPSNLRLAAMSNGNNWFSQSNTSQHSIFVANTMMDTIGVCNPGQRGTKLGRQNAVYQNDPSNIPHIFSDLNVLVAGSATETVATDIIWRGDPICKITDMAGNLLNFNESAPAVFYSVADAFRTLASSTFNGTPAYVKMLCNYEMRITANMTTAIANDIIFTTAGISDAEYPFRPSDTETTATLYKGNLTGTAMFKLTNTAHTLTVENINFDGRRNATASTSPVANTSYGMFSLNPSNTEPSVQQLIMKGSIRNIRTTSGNSPIHLANRAKAEIAMGAFIDNCTGTVSGAVARVQTYSTLTMTGGTVMNCNTTSSGGAFQTDQRSTIVINVAANDSVKFENCHSDYGGAIYCQNDCTVTNAGSIEFTNCTTNHWGGGICVDHNNHHLYMNDNSGTISFTDCSAAYGGGVETDNSSVFHANNNSGTIRFLRCKTTDTAPSFHGCTGGGLHGDNNLEILNNSGIISFEECFATATSNSKGGGLYAGGVLTMESTGDGRFVFEDCYSHNGGGLAVNKAATIKGATFTGCYTTTGNGGAVYTNSTAQLADVEISGCTAMNRGGGIYANNNLTLLDNISVTGNTLANDNVGNGAGVYMNDGRTIVFGSEGDGGNHVRIRDNSVSSMELVTDPDDPSVVIDTVYAESASNLRLSSWNSDNRSNSVRVNSVMQDTVYVCNPGHMFTQLGTQPSSGMSDPMRAVHYHILSDINALKAGTHGTDFNKVIWLGTPICKITDADGHLLNYTYEEVDPADTTQVVTNRVQAVFFSISDAFKRLSDASFLDQSDANATPKYVKMLCDHAMKEKVTVGTSDYDNLIFTTAGTNPAQEDDYPFTPNPETPDATEAVVLRGTVTTTLFMLNSAEHLTLEHVIIDGRKTFDQEPDQAPIVNANVFQLGNANAMLSMANGATLRNNRCRYNYSPVVVNYSATLIISDGALISDSRSVSGTAYGGAVNLNNGTLDMNGGRIENCRATNGGAIYISNNANNHAIISGGTITGNYATSFGGGIYANNNLTLASNATITDNHVFSTDVGRGAGVYMVGQGSSPSNWRTLTIGSEGDGGNNVTIIDNTVVTIVNDTLVDSNVSNLRLASYTSGSKKGDNWEEAIRVNSVMNGHVGVCNPGKATTQFGTQPLTAMSDPGHVSHITSDVNTLKGVSFGPNGIVWEGIPVCKFTDSEGTILYYTSGTPAIFYSVNDAFAELCSDITYQGGSTPAYVKMLLNYPMKTVANMQANLPYDVTLTTAGIEDGDEYPFHPDGTETIATLYKGNLTNSTMFRLANTSHTLTIEGINIDGRTDGTASTSPVSASSNGMFHLNPNNTEPSAPQLVVKGTIHNIYTTSGYSPIYLEKKAWAEIASGAYIENCSARVYGGVARVLSNSTLTLTGGEVSNCSSTTYGGAFYADGNGNITINVANPAETLTIQDCHSNSYGGAIYSRNALSISSAEPDHVLISDCSASYGGGIYAYGNATIATATITNCTATNYGGGLYAYSTLTVSGTVKIGDNHKGTALNNVYMAASNKTVNIADEGLLCGSHIGIANNSGNNRVVATGLEANCRYAGANRFFFDDTDAYRAYCLSYTDGSVTYTPDKIYFIDNWRNHTNASGFTVTGDEIVVTTAAGLAQLAYNVNNGLTDYSDAPTIRLGADIDLSAYNWEPIGLASTCAGDNAWPFKGTFDGGGHIIRGLRSYLPYKSLGLFGLVGEGGTVTNTFIESGTLEYTYSEGGAATSQVMGGLVGTLEGGTVTYSEAAVTMTENTECTMGGLVGAMTGTAEHPSTIHSSMAMSNMTGDHAQGGLVGMTGLNTTLANSFANAKFTVTGNPTVGGLVGVSSGTVSNCYSRVQAGSATGSGFGWLAGTNSGTISNSYIPANETAFIGGDNTVPSGCGTYTATALASGKYGYGQDDQKVGEGDHLMDLLNANATGDYAKWTRTMASPINGDYPVLLMPGSNSLASKNGLFIVYGSDVNGMITYANPSNGSVYLYDTNPTTITTSTSGTTRVYIGENVGVLQGNSTVLNARVGVTFDNSSGNDLGGKPYDWHMFSSALREAPLGITYDNTGEIGFGVEVTDEDITVNGDGYFPSNTPIVSFDFYTYHEPSRHWINFKRNSNSHWHQTTQQQIIYDNEDILTQGKGYLMAVDSMTMLMADGRLNNGNVYYSVSYSPSGDPYDAVLTGINLIGNPYQSYLDFDLFVANDEDASWNSPNNGNILDNAYYILDADKGGYIAHPYQASSNSEYAPRYIHPHQGFMVAVPDGVSSLTFNNDMRRATGDEYSYFRGEQINYPLVNLICTDANGKRDLTTVEIDRPEQGGARKLMNMRAGDASLYAHFNNQGYQALYAPQGVREVPVRLEVVNDGVFTMTWSMFHGDFNYVHLVDNLTGVDIDMLTNDSYRFEASTDDYASRFRLVFDVTGIEEYDDDDDQNGPSIGSGSFAFFDGNTWVVTGEGVLQLFDVNGRCLMSTNVEGTQSSVNLPNVAAGVYLLRLTNGDGPRVQKIVVK